MLLAMAVTLAMPDALDTAAELDNTALAPVAGTVKVTVTPPTGFPAESLTVTCSGFVKAAPNRADCGVPAVAVMLAIPVFDSEKFAVNVPTVAVTV
jgi:hypothetical protein